MEPLGKPLCPWVRSRVLQLSFPPLPPAALLLGASRALCPGAHGESAAVVAPGTVCALV